MKRLRKLIRENIEKVLNESMDMYVQGFEKGDDLDGLGSIGFYLSHKIIQGLLPHLDLTPEERGEIRGLSNSFAPDGEYYWADETGVINFYPHKSDYPERILDKTLEYIRYVLNEKDVKVGEFKKEKMKERLSPERIKELNLNPEEIRVVRIPILENGAVNREQPPSINLANSNAKKFFGDILGFEDEGSSFSMDAADLLMKIDSARKQMQVNQEIPNEKQGVKQGNMYSTINDKDYYYRLFDRAEEFAKWALDRGYRSLYVS